MRGRLATFLLFAVGLSAPVEGRAMTMAGNCRVASGDKYLGSDGGKSVCREIETAIAAEAPGVRYSAEISALSSSRLAARLTVNGRQLPEHKFAVMDAQLDRESVHRFARALAADVAKAAKK